MMACSVALANYALRYGNQVMVYNGKVIIVPPGVVPPATSDLFQQYLMADVGGTNNTVYTRDTSVNNITGTVNSATWTGGTNGLLAGLGSYDFDGANDYICSPDDDAYAARQLTASVWFKALLKHIG